MPLRGPLADLGDTQRFRFAHASLGFMCVAAAALIGRTVGDTLFLSRFGPHYLTYMYPLTAVVMGCLAYGYGLLACRMALARLIGLATLALIACLAGLRVLLIDDSSATRLVAYVVGDLVVNLPMLLFWSFAALLFDPREAKRLFGLVGAGGTTACIVAGFTVRPLASSIGTANLILPVIVLLAVFYWAVHRVSARDGVASRRPDRSARAGVGYYGRLLSTPQIRVLVSLIVVATMSVTLVDYQFKAAAKQSYVGDDLAAFFGTFYGSASAIALLIQLFLVRLVLQRGGVFLGLTIMPAALVVASIGTAVTATFGWIVATKFAFQVFAFTVDSAAVQMLYLGIATQSRSQARALAEGIGKPFAIGITGLLLVVASGAVPLHLLAVATTVLATAWIVLAHRNHKAYVGALLESIGSRRFYTSNETAAIQDKAFEAHLRETLTGGSDEDVSYLLKILPTVGDVDWTPEFRQILSRDAPDLKLRALEHLAEHGCPDDAHAVAGLLGHCDPCVRAEAITTLMAISDADPLEDIERCLDDPAVEPRSAAIACLVNSGDLDRLLAAGTALKALLESGDTSERRGAAEALAQIKRGGLVRPLVSLLEDDDPEVVRAALRACRAQPDHLLLPIITSLLADPTVAPDAADALVAYGSDSLDHLIPHIELTEREEAFAGTQGIPAILARIGDLKAVGGLLHASGSKDPVLRSEAIQGFIDLLYRNGAETRYEADIANVVESELDASSGARACRQELEGRERSEVLCAALDHQGRTHLLNALRLLNLRLPDVDLTLLYRSVERGGQLRSSALEVFDNVVRGPQKTTLMSLLAEDRPATVNVPDPVGAVLDDSAPDGVLIGALYVVSARPDAESSLNSVQPLLGHRSPIVRETALFTIDTIDHALAQATARKMTGDEFPAVRRLADEILQAGNPTPPASKDRSP